MWKHALVHVNSLSHQTSNHIIWNQNSQINITNVRIWIVVIRWAQSTGTVFLVFVTGSTWQLLIYVWFKQKWFYPSVRPQALNTYNVFASQIHNALTWSNLVVGPVVLAKHCMNRPHLRHGHSGWSLAQCAMGPVAHATFVPSFRLFSPFVNRWVSSLDYLFLILCFSRHSKTHTHTHTHTRTHACTHARVCTRTHTHTHTHTPTHTHTHTHTHRHTHITHTHTHTRTRTQTQNKTTTTTNTSRK